MQTVTQESIRVVKLHGVTEQETSLQKYTWSHKGRLAWDIIIQSLRQSASV